MQIFGREWKSIFEWRNRYLAFACGTFLFYGTVILLDYFLFGERSMRKIFLHNLILALFWSGFMLLIVKPVKKQVNTDPTEHP